MRPWWTGWPCWATLSRTLTKPALNTPSASVRRSFWRTSTTESSRLLFYILVDMVAGHFLFDKKAAGGLDGLEGFDFNAPAKSITEGDISVTFAGASDGASNAESRFDAMLAQLMHPAESTLAAFRRLRW